MSVAPKASPGRPSLVDGAERAMRDWLAPGRFREGDRLPPEQELASMLGVSRGTLRSALSRLENAGAIVRRQGSGTFVARTQPPEQGFVRRHQRVDRWALHAADPGAVVARVAIEPRPLGGRAAAALSSAETVESQTFTRLLTVEGRPAGLCVDVLVPGLSIPDGSAVRRLLDEGVTMFDLLDGCDVPVAATYSTVSAAMVVPREDAGRELALSEPAAAATVEEIVVDVDAHAVVFSRRIFLPGLIWMEIVQSREPGPPTPLEH